MKRNQVCEDPQVWNECQEMDNLQRMLLLLPHKSTPLLFLFTFVFPFRVSLSPMYTNTESRMYIVLPSTKITLPEIIIFFFVKRVPSIGKGVGEVIPNRDTFRMYSVQHITKNVSFVCFLFQRFTYPYTRYLNHSSV